MKPRIIAGTDDRAGCNFYRMWMPLAWLTQQGKIQGHVTNCVADYEFFGGDKENRKADVLGLQRPMHPGMYGLLTNWHPMSYVDIDDNFFDLPRLNPCHYDMMLAKKKTPPGCDPATVMTESLKIAEIITTTNVALANRIVKQTQRTKNIKIIPNGFYDIVEEHEINERRKQKFGSKGLIRIGWWGAYHHFEDFVGLDEMLAEFAERHINEVELVFMGWCPPKLFESGLVEMHGWTDTTQFYTKLWNLDLDICLGPLVDNDFSICKSNIKWLETAMLKRCFVGLTSEVFNDCIDNGNTGVLAGSPKEMVDTLERLISDKSEIQRIGDESYQAVQDEWHIRHRENQWMEVFHHLYDMSLLHEYKLEGEELERYNKSRSQFEQLNLEEIFNTPADLKNPRSFNIWRNA